MRQILSLNAFNLADAARLDSHAAAQVRRRAGLFGAASVLFYDQPLQFVRGEGCWLYDADNVAYLDAYNNVPSVGHCHPQVVQAVARQMGLLNTHSRYLCEGVETYAENLLSTLPPALSNITFTCTGSESNDLALRLAQNATGGTGIIVTDCAYHGNTSSVAQVSPSALKQGQLSSHVRTVPAPSALTVGADRLSAHFAGLVEDAILDLQNRGIKFAALLVDSIFSSDGIFADPPGFLSDAVAVAQRAGGLFIADEVQPGFGRTGATLWGFQRHAVEPDIVTMGKPMGNGYPIGAVVTRPQILTAFCETIGYFNTFGGTAVAAAAGQAVLDVIAGDGLMDNATQVGAHLRHGLAALALQYPLIREVRGAGLYVGVDLAGQGRPAPVLARTVINFMRERRVLIGAAGRDGDVLKIRPPLCFSIQQADRLIEALDDSLRAALSNGADPAE